MPPPPRSIYSPKIRSLIRRLKNPAQVQRWLLTLQYNKRETMHTLPGVVRTDSAHCLEAAMSAAVMLEQYNYPPLILDMESADRLDHTLFLYKHRGKYGTVGLSRDVGLNGRKPIYKTIRALVQSYAAPYIDAHANLKAYGVLDLRTLKSDRWRTSTTNVWYVEESLRQIPHRKIHLSKAFVQYWRKRYRDFKKKHPTKQPDFYPNQQNWV